MQVAKMSLSSYGNPVSKFWQWDKAGEGLAIDCILFDSLKRTALISINRKLIPESLN